MRSTIQSIGSVLPLATLAGIAFMSTATIAPQPANACVADGGQTLGSVCITAATFCPRGYAWMAGQVVPISENQALYALLGNRYGGDGRSSFGYPDMRGRTAVGVGRGPGLSEEVELGQVRGSEAHTLSMEEMPSHSHAAAFTPTGESEIDVKLYARNGPGVDPEPGPNVQLAIGNFPSGFSSTQVKNYAPPFAGAEVELGGIQATTSGDLSGSVAVDYTGGNIATGATESFPTIPPQLGLNWCIATTGLFPQRN